MSFISASEADKNTYDVIVVGSGAAGGQTAYTLTMEGRECSCSRPAATTSPPPRRR